MQHDSPEIRLCVPLYGLYLWHADILDRFVHLTCFNQVSHNSYYVGQWFSFKPLYSFNAKKRRRIHIRSFWAAKVVYTHIMQLCYSLHCVFVSDESKQDLVWCVSCVSKDRLWNLTTQAHEYSVLRPEYMWLICTQCWCGHFKLQLIKSNRIKKWLRYKVQEMSLWNN